MNYIVDFIDSMTLTEVEKYLKDKNISIVKHLSSFNNVFIVSSDSVPVVDDQLLVVINDNDSSNIKLLGLDITLSDSDIGNTFDIHEEKNWWKVASINTLDFDQPTYTHVVRGFGSTVYLMDSGIEETHPEFTDTNIVKLHSITGEFSDTTGHGTALASLISGKTCGLTGATLKIVKIFDKSTPLKQSDLLIAFNAIAEDYIASGKTLSIVNMSWGFANNEYINEKIDQLANMGLFLVAAAGNAGVPINNITPASVKSVFTVGAYNENLTPCDFSNYTGSESILNTTNNATNHGELDSWAPGEKIWVAGLNGTYGFASGTSEAAAITSGALAYNLSMNTNFTGQGPEQYTSYSKMLETMRKNWKPSKNGYQNSLFNLENVSPYALSSLRTNLLDLSNPKYVDSFNRIVTYKSGVDSYFPTRNVFATSNSTTYSIIAERSSVARIVTSQELPDYITIDTNGMLKVSPPTITDPYVSLPTIELNMFNRDGSTSTMFLNIILLREDVNKDTAPTILPDDDAVLNLMLYTLCSSALISTGCAYSCGSIGGCANAGKYCACFFTSDYRLKTNINLIDQIDGINIYEYNYIWDLHTKYISPMAQELLNTTYKNAVQKVDNLYYVVDINQLPDSIKILYTNR